MDLPSDVQVILATALWANARHGITGVLGWERTAYVQVLEGPASELDELMARIERDPRHADLRVLERHTIQRRLFPGWSLSSHPLSSAGWRKRLARGGCHSLIDALSALFESGLTRVS